MSEGRYLKEYFCDLAKGLDTIASILMLRDDISADEWDKLRELKSSINYMIINNNE